MHVCMYGCVCACVHTIDLLIYLDTQLRKNTDIKSFSKMKSLQFVWQKRVVLFQFVVTLAKLTIDSAYCLLFINILTLPPVTHH